MNDTIYPAVNALGPETTALVNVLSQAREPLAEVVLLRHTGLGLGHVKLAAAQVHLHLKAVLLGHLG